MPRVRGVAADVDPIRRQCGHAFHEDASPRERVTKDDQLARPRRPTQRQDEEPVAVAKRWLHAPPRDGDGDRPYFFVAQKMSLISFTADCRSVAAAASTFCLFLLHSLAAFQKVSWSFGYFSRCSGLK